ncbi:MAG: hypothetical protein IJ464_07480 [Alistipes sp.]|nr:hypothetical protein [Alistipes sp.]
MKKIIMTFMAVATVMCAMAQTSKPIPIGVYVSSDEAIVPAMAQATLTDKMRQVVTLNGLGADNHAQFFITCSVNLTDKEVITGAPTRIVQHADLTFYIADAGTQRVYETCAMSVRGVGENENKAFASAFKNVKPTSQEFKGFVERASKKIVDYYESQIDNFIKQAQSLAKMGEYESALYILSAVPDVCEGFDKVNDAAIEVYQKMIDGESLKNLQKAKTVWAAGHSYEAAEEAGGYLAEVSPYASCYAEAEALAEEIKEFVIEERAYDREQAEEQIDWWRTMAENEQYLEEKRVDAWREVGVAYGENQQEQHYGMWWME